MNRAIKFKNKNNEYIYPCPYFPVGSIYMNINNVNPGSIFGGTWERIKGKFLLGADDNKYKAGNIGGEENHKLLVDEMPSHNHAQDSHSHTVGDRRPSGFVPAIGWYGYGHGAALPYHGGAGASDSDLGTYKMMTENATPYIHNAGGNKVHNNMPPYIVVYIWKRIS